MNTKDMGWNLDNSYLKLPKVFFSKVKPNLVSSPKLEIFNDKLATALGFNIKELKSEDGINILGGNKAVEGETLLAQAYAGHQFGHFTMLGDGRAMLVGEQISPENMRYDIQLKGAGKTPYSRGGDGRAALGPMLREYLISESMHSLGIPTTRSLSVVTTGEKVYRETPLLGAILTRVAKSHIRVGTFQFAAGFEDKEVLRSIADYTINRHFPFIKDEENPYVSLLKEVINLQADLIAKWQLVGFVHGVMNTDNMTISGETIDYGPCAFMNSYDPKTVFSSIDRNGRYAYGNQPNIAAWNLARFGESLLGLISDNNKEAIKIVEEAVNHYFYLYNNNWINGMRLKLGILNEENQDKDLISELLELMDGFKSDFTNTFVGLTVDDYKYLDKSGLFKSEEFRNWEDKWNNRLKRQDNSLGFSIETMKKNNPIIIPRNHQVEKALKSASDTRDYTLFNDLLKALSNPYNYEKNHQEGMMVAEKSNIPYRTFCGT